MLTHFLMKESTSNVCVDGRMYLLQMFFLCLVKYLQALKVVLFPFPDNSNQLHVS